MWWHLLETGRDDDDFVSSASRARERSTEWPHAHFFGAHLFNHVKKNLAIDGIASICKNRYLLDRPLLHPYKHTHTHTHTLACLTKNEATSQQ